MARGLRTHARVNPTVRLFTIAGIPISVHASWLAVYALITWTLAAGYFPRVLPELGPVASWIYGLVAALLLFASVLVHELAHSVVATAHGLRVRGITLHVFGGVSLMEEEPATARAEALIAIAGPIASFAIAGTLWVVRVVAASGGLGGHLGALPTSSVGAIADYLMTVNVAVGVFNLIPGYPLDGGRLLRALLWRWNGSPSRATYTASRVGVALAMMLMMLGVFEFLGGSVVGGIWLVLIGLFLQSAAKASSSQVALRQALDRLPVSAIMAREVVTVTPDTSIAELVDHFWAHHYTTFPVVEAGAVAGIASLAQAQQVVQDQWRVTRVRDVMRPVDASLTARPGESAFVALERATENGIGRLAVIDAGRLVGYLSLKDITHALALRGLVQPPRAGAAIRDGAPPRLRRVA